MSKEITKEEYLQNLEHLFEVNSALDLIYNYDCITISDYYKIKNRIIDEIICLKEYAVKHLEGDFK